MQEELKEDRSSTSRWRVAAVMAAVGAAALAIVVATTSSDLTTTNPIALAGGDRAVGSVPTVNCPAVANKLPKKIPERAKREVRESLALLDTQIANANNEIVTRGGQGGPNFIQNAINGPLEDKRFAVLNRIATAIDRDAVRPVGLEKLAPCSLNRN